MSLTEYFARTCRVLNRLVVCVGALLLSISFIGCDRSSSIHSNAAQANLANEYLLTTEPANPISLTQAAEQLSEATDSEDPGDETAAPQVVTLIGKIDAGDFPAFQAGQATFMLSELPADGHGLNDPDHEDNCPFCKRRAANAPKAVVHIVDADGQPLSTDARELLGVAQGDRVIAVGSARFDNTVNMITLQCNGVYRSR